VDLLTSLVLTLTLCAIGFYVLYWIVRKAVAHGIRDARVTRAAKPEDTARTAHQR
jgi:hypothetical protein